MSGVASAYCSAPPPKVCSAYFQADVVVRGKVLSVQRDPDWIHYKVKVDETFKGEQIAVRSFDTGNDSGRLPLDVGTEHVLFAYRDNDQLLVSYDELSLSESSNVRRVSQQIAQVRRSKSTLAIIEGQILSSDYSAPLSGVTVTAAGADGIHRTVSNAMGLFSMRVPPGQYRVDVDPAIAEQTIYSQGYVNPKAIHLVPGQCAQLQYAGKSR
jgi:hypothetical protein